MTTACVRCWAKAVWHPAGANSKYYPAAKSELAHHNVSMDFTFADGPLVLSLETSFKKAALQGASSRASKAAALRYWDVFEKLRQRPDPALFELDKVTAFPWPHTAVVAFHRLSAVFSDHPLPL